MSECKYCYKEIPCDSVQVDGVHMYCEEAYFNNKTEKIVKIRPASGGSWLICYPSELAEIIRNEETEERFTIEILMVSKGYMNNLKEWDGW